MMDPKTMQAMRLEMEKQAISSAALRRAGSVVARGAKGLGGAAGRAAVGAGRAVADFGKRQVHGFTGLMGDSLTSGLKRRQASLAKQMEGATGDQLKKLVRKSKDVASEIGHREAAHKAGITSLPGLAKGLVTKPKETGKALWRHTTGGSKAGTALALGVPGAMAAWDLRKGDESDQGGSSIGQKLVRHGTQLGTGILTGGMSIIPGMVTSTAIEGGVSKAYNKARDQFAPKREAPVQIGQAGQQAATRAGQTLARRVSGPVRTDR